MTATLLHTLLLCYWQHVLLGSLALGFARMTYTAACLAVGSKNGR